MIAIEILIVPNNYPDPYNIPPNRIVAIVQFPRIDPFERSRQRSPMNNKRYDGP